MRDLSVVPPFDAESRLYPCRPGPQGGNFLCARDAGVDRWLDVAVERVALLELLQPLDAGALTTWRISRRVNAPQNHRPGLIAPV